MKFYLGIDFGAANIMAAWISEDNDVIQRLRFKDSEASDGNKNKTWLPNWYATEKNGTEYFGWDAKNLHEKHALNEHESEIDFYYNYKICLHEFGSEKRENDRNRAKYAMEKVLGFIKEQAEIQFRMEELEYVLEKLVLTVPVGWAESKTRELYLEVVGKVFPQVVVRLVAEPVAASIPLLNLIHKDGEEKNCLIVDIGASTLDVSLVKDVGMPPLEVEKGFHNTFAGNYCDKKIAEWLQKKNIASEQDAMHKAIELKEGGKKKSALDSVFGGWAMRKAAEAMFNIFTDVKNSWSDLKAKRLSQEMAEKAVETIGETIDQLQNGAGKIDYLLFCGGMSKFEWGYIDNIITLLKKQYPGVMEHCQVDRDLPEQLSITDEMRDMAIAKGAARLAKDPALVVEQLGYDVGAVLSFNNMHYYPPVIRADIKLLNDRQEFSFYESVQKLKNEIPQINNNGFTLRPNDLDSIPIWFRRPGKKRHTFHALLDNSWARTKMEGQEEIVELPSQGSSYDLNFVIDEDGIIQINLIDLQNNTTIGTAHYDVNSPHELKIG